ncbi:MAG: hypothetical protein HQK77_14885 [Desulfobacterales bacterium]|nr:hypothetical protein [Desulfobacterales bacterium]
MEKKRKKKIRLIISNNIMDDTANIKQLESVNEEQPDRVEKAGINCKYSKSRIQKNFYPQNNCRFNDEYVDIDPLPSKIANDLVIEEIGDTLKMGGLIGGAISGVISSAKNIKAVSTGEKKTSTATIDTVKDTTKGGIDGAVKGVAILGTRATLIRAGVSTLARSAAPIAIGITGVEMVKDVGKTIKGKMSKKKLAKETGKHVVKGVTLWGGIEAGFALGTAIAPGIGTIIGGLIGGISGSLIGSLVVE